MDVIMNSTELIQDFVNTLHKDISGDEEELESPAELASWLSGRDLVGKGAKATAAELRLAKEFREALRTLLLAKNEVEVNEAPAQEVLDRIACKARVGLRFENGQAALVPA